MTINTQTSLWAKFKKHYFYDKQSGFALDISRMNFEADFFNMMEVKIQNAFKAMAELESGAIANPDEKRMVGHYWLRNSKLAPRSDLQEQIDSTLKRIKEFVTQIHSGKIAPERGGKFSSALVIGIGGSALGPQFVAASLGTVNDAMKMFFIDNTDPDGIAKVVTSIPNLAQNLTVVISKSGGTKETRNGMLEIKAVYEGQKLNFGKHCVAITGAGSELDQVAQSGQWIARFPMWDWVGGRTSELSAVGLLPAALQGINIDEMLRGAGYMDELTRKTVTSQNPAALLALMWFHAGAGRGTKDMVVLPYKDRLELFSKYLQQLVMESLGKERDLENKVVNQGLAVYGNKGSTDQHAYVQQLRDGVNNFFAVFIEVLQDSNNKAHLNVEPNVTSGDYLSGFYQGTREALYQNSRESISITIPKVDAFNIGLLIALFERAVGLYATLVNINAYHQPGVEAGKKAAASVLALQSEILKVLQAEKSALTLEEIAEKTGNENIETIFKILRHLGANQRINVVTSDSVFVDKYRSCE